MLQEDKVFFHIYNVYLSLLPLIGSLLNTQLPEQKIIESKRNRCRFVFSREIERTLEGKQLYSSSSIRVKRKSLIQSLLAKQ